MKTPLFSATSPTNRDVGITELVTFSYFSVVAVTVLKAAENKRTNLLRVCVCVFWQTKMSLVRQRNLFSFGLNSTISRNFREILCNAGNDYQTTSFCLNKRFFFNPYNANHGFWCLSAYFTVFAFLYNISNLIVCLSGRNFLADPWTDFNQIWLGDLGDPNGRPKGVHFQKCWYLKGENDLF